MSNARNFIRATSLVAGEQYVAMVWTAKRTFDRVKFCYFYNAADDSVVNKIPQLNTIKNGDAVQFVSSTGVPFIAVRDKDYLVDARSGRRVTFGVLGAYSDVVDEDVVQDAVVDEPVVELVQAVADVVVDKLAARRLKDMLRKRLSRAAAKQLIAA